jgi:hypothetical protein
MTKRHNAVQCTPAERQEVARGVTRGNQSARAMTRARSFLLTRGGRRVPQSARPFGVSRGALPAGDTREPPQAARAPLVAARTEAPRSGRPLTLERRGDAEGTRRAGPAPPPGRARWPLQLLAAALVQLGGPEAGSQRSVRPLRNQPAASPGARDRGAEGKARATPSGLRETSGIKTSARMLPGLPCSVPTSGPVSCSTQGGPPPAASGQGEARAFGRPTGWLVRRVPGLCAPDRLSRGRGQGTANGGGVCRLYAPPARPLLPAGPLATACPRPAAPSHAGALF